MPTAVTARCPAAWRERHDERNLIEVKGVSKAYGGVKALSLCDLEVREGAINGLIGPNGSGKTTLFNVITGYERIQQGRVDFNGTRDHQRPA